MIMFWTVHRHAKQFTSVLSLAGIRKPRQLVPPLPMSSDGHVMPPSQAQEAKSKELLADAQ